MYLDRVSVSSDHSAMQTDATIVRRSVSSQIASALVEILESGKYEAGDLFPGEQELAERYQVSRPVIREAFRALEAQGYIAIRKGQRARVLPPGARLLDSFFSRLLSQDIGAWEQLMDVRESLELLSARSAARNRDPADLAQLRRIVTDMEKTINSPEEYSLQDINFHVALAASTGNPFLRYLIESVRRSLVEVLTGMRRRLPPRFIPHVQASHVLIVDAVESSDEEAASEAMRKHFETVRMNLEELHD